MLLLKHDETGGLKLALIEELEAHLHPQAQLRLIDYLQNEYNKSGAQIIISTHSTILASKINLKNLILMKHGCGYDLTYGETGLEKGDYLFLQRFLDATKSNLFFAKGVIMVEGDAENLLLPVLAEILGYQLEKYGNSIVNVGSTAFLRYSRIFIRKDGSTIGIPVSVVTEFDDASIDKVVGKYILALDENGLYDPNGIYKIIGAVKKRDLAGLKIGDYWAEYDDRNNLKSEYNYWNYVRRISEGLSEGKLYYVEGQFRSLLCKILHYAGVKNKISGRKIVIDTVHGVKGETHDATLYLETEKSRSSDIRRILPYLGVGKKGSQAISEYSRKCVYVGMSRPRKLLCLAVRAETYEEGKKVFQIWKVIDCRV